MKGFTFDEKTHTYRYDGKRMTGVTTILNVLAKPALIPWAARMAVEYAIEHSTEYADGIYRVSKEVMEEAKNAHAKKRDARAEEGSDLHALAEDYIKECIEKNGGKPVETPHSGLKSFAAWALKENIVFLSSEEKFYSVSLFVAGTADFTFTKDGKHYVGDIKNKAKIWSREPFYQCAAYSILAEEMWAAGNSEAAPFSGYCVIRLWADELEALWSYDVEGDRKAFLACLELYRQNAKFVI